MSATASEEELVDALVDYVDEGIYPTSEHVASADLPNAALPALLKGIQQGQEAVKTELRELSRSAAGDLDGWIAQAKKLQSDIDESKVTANKILQEGSQTEVLHEKEQDASSKTNLLRKELDFNETLIGALEQLQIATGLLDKARDLESENELVQAVQELGKAQRVTSQLDSLQNSRFAGLISRRASQIKDGLSTKISKSWTTLVKADHSDRSIAIRNEVDEDGIESTLQDTVAAMEELGTLDTHISRLYRELDSLIIGPRFLVAADGANMMLSFNANQMSVSGRTEGHDLAVLSDDVEKLVTFLKDHLPEAALKLLLDRLLPNLLVQIINEQLDPSVPVAVDELVTYGPLMGHIQMLATFVDQTGIDIPSDGDIAQWIERLPQNWLSQRREAALNSLRTACYDAVKVRNVAERVETQMVSSDDVMVAREHKDEEWNEDWGDEEVTAEAEHDVKEHPEAGEEGEEAEGWGWGDEGAEGGTKDTENEPEKDQKEGEDDEEEGDEWGWGGDETNEANDQPIQAEAKKAASNKTLQKPAASKPQTSAKSKPVITQQEITLRETFQITAIPDTLLDLINAVLDDAASISQPSFPIPEIRAAVAALSPIPTLLLALYRATARSFYSSTPAADMLIYNDSQDLAKRLESLLADLPPDHPLARRLPRAIETEVKSLQSFSRLAYGREMDSQRTILSDLLSSTSGFTSCTNPLNAREYTNAIDDVVARITEIDTLWKDILCDSARKQSLGALLSHVIRKLVEDVLELASEPAGISEPESKQLKTYIDRVAGLADLFNMGYDGKGEITHSLVHVYTPAWLRFVYLGELLEASLADIKFLWTEGELSLEYEADEVVELIVALFAESEHRRSAIREIRRSAGP